MDTLVYPLLKGSLGGVKQLGALHPKGFPIIFPMIESSSICNLLGMSSKTLGDIFSPKPLLRNIWGHDKDWIINPPQVQGVHLDVQEVIGSMVIGSVDYFTPIIPPFIHNNT